MKKRHGLKWRDLFSGMMVLGAVIYFLAHIIITRLGYEIPKILWRGASCLWAIGMLWMLATVVFLHIVEE